jgi:hypothetical protein
VFYAQYDSTYSVKGNGITVFEETEDADGNKGIRIGNKQGHTVYWLDDVTGEKGAAELDDARKQLAKYERDHDKNVRLSKVKDANDFWEYLKSIGEADEERGVQGYDIKEWVKQANAALSHERELHDVVVPMLEELNEDAAKRTDNVDKLQDEVDVWVKGQDIQTSDDLRTLRTKVMRYFDIDYGRATNILRSLGYATEAAEGNDNTRTSESQDTRGEKSKPDFADSDEAYAYEKATIKQAQNKYYRQAKADSTPEVLSQKSDEWLDQRIAELEKYEDDTDDGIRFRMAHDKNDFAEMQERAENERGLVMPDLNEKSVNIVNVPRHGTRRFCTWR